MLACCCFSRYLRLAALASECPLTRRRQMLDIGLGTGYLSSSAGAKQKRQDAKAIEELISDQVEHDPIKHLRILEYMASKFRTNHPTVEPAQQTLLALQVLEGVKDLLKTLKVMFKGRYPNAVRQDLQAVLSVVASTCTNLKGLAELLDTDYENLLRYKRRYHDFAEGNGQIPPVCLHDSRGKTRKDTTPADWVKHGKSFWLPPYTRPGVHTCHARALWVGAGGAVKSQGNRCNARGRESTDGAWS